MALAATSRRVAEDPLECLLVLGDGNRLRILMELRRGEQCVCTLTENLAMPQPLLSHHLKVLRKAGLVRGRKDGRWVHYALVPDVLVGLERFLAEVRRDALNARPVPTQC